MADSLTDKLGIYDIFGIFFSGCIISICSMWLATKIEFFNLNLKINNINGIFVFIIISFFIGIIFQESSSFIHKKIFKKNNFLKESLESKNNNYLYMSKDEIKKLLAKFPQYKDNTGVVRLKNVDRKFIYNQCKYYLIEKNNTALIDKNLALSAMARSLSFYFFYYFYCFFNMYFNVWAI